MTSFHPEDKAQGYCGNCHQFTGQPAGESGPVEPPWGARFTEDGQITWEAPELRLGRSPRPDKYYPDGSPILDDELLPAFMKWAMLFEQRDGDRIVGQTKTLYGEKLSTVWLGLDHNFFSTGPPLIYETMLFAPDRDNVRRRTISALADAARGGEPDPEAEAEHKRFEAYIDKHYPHDQLQLRYATRREAQDSHERLKLQCLIPPRWRHFLLWTIGRITTWKHYDDEEEC